MLKTLGPKSGYPISVGMPEAAVSQYIVHYVKSACDDFTSFTILCMWTFKMKAMDLIALVWYERGSWYLWLPCFAWLTVSIRVSCKSECNWNGAWFTNLILSALNVHQPLFRDLGQLKLNTSAPLILTGWTIGYESGSPWHTSQCGRQSKTTFCIENN